MANANDACNASNGSGSDDYETNDQMSSCQFDLHHDSVYSVALNPVNSMIAATGSGDETVYIWNTISGDTIYEVKGHKDSVNALQFSSNGEFLASGCMEGVLLVTRSDLSNPEFGSVASSIEIGDEITWIQWHSCGPVILVGTSAGSTWLWSVVSNQAMHILDGHTGPVSAGTFYPRATGKKVLTASDDGSLIAFDPKTGLPEWKLTKDNSHFTPGEDEGWTSLDTNNEGTVAVLGSSSGICRVISLSRGNIITTLNHHTESIESIRWSIFKPIVAIASVDGSVSLVDPSSWRLRCKLQQADMTPFTNVRLTNHDEYAITTSTSGKLCVWNSLSGELLAELTGHKDTILAIDMTDDGQTIVTGSDDNLALVFHLEID